MAPNVRVFVSTCETAQREAVSPSSRSRTMPRYRTIACDHCGYLQLKRDTQCDGCGRLTRRERNRWIAKAAQVGVVLLVGVFMYAKLKGLAPQ